jgi:hypothetical protein
MKSVQRRGRAHAGRRTFLGCQFDVQNPNVLAGLLIDWIFMLVRGNGHAVNHVVIAKVIAVAKLLVAGKWKFYIKFALPLGLLLISDKFIAMSRDTRHSGSSTNHSRDIGCRNTSNVGNSNSSALGIHESLRQGNFHCKVIIRWTTNLAFHLLERSRPRKEDITGGSL